MTIELYGLTHGTFHGAVLFVATLIAALCICLPNLTVRGWAWTGFVALATGMLPLVLMEGSVTALVLVIAAAAGLAYGHHRRGTSQSQAQSSPSVAGSTSSSSFIFSAFSARNP
jgi:transitional endoplasmic reticulum ATPase